jgi:hypothetical protein
MHSLKVKYEEVAKILSFEMPVEAPPTAWATKQ